MKRHILRVLAVLIFASAIMSGCAIEYREHHHWDHDHGRSHDDHDHDDDYRNQ